jgi:hypothetical protein
MTHIPRKVGTSSMSKKRFANVWDAIERAE